VTADPGRVRLRDFPHLVAIRRDTARRTRLLRHPDLTYLFWEATLRCNLRCGHCGSSCQGESPVRELETDELFAILDTIAEDFDASRIFVSITGGEPLLRPDLFAVVRRMTDLGLRSCIVTNGTLLGEREAACLVEAGMRTVSVSIDGDEETHDAVRGRGTYGPALAALSRAHSAGFTTVEAITCVRPANLDRLRGIEPVVREAGASLWRCITIDRMGRLAGREAPAMWLEPEGVRRLLDFIEERREDLAAGREPFGVSFSCGGFLGLGREGVVRAAGNQCHAGLCVASILCDGAVSACPSLPRAWAQGSALRSRFSDIWRGRFERLRDFAWRREGLCAGCSFFPVCLGGGLHERLVQPDSFCWLDRQDG